MFERSSPAVSSSSSTTSSACRQIASDSNDPLTATTIDYVTNQRPSHRLIRSGHASRVRSSTLTSKGRSAKRKQFRRRTGIRCVAKRDQNPFVTSRNSRNRRLRADVARNRLRLLGKRGRESAIRRRRQYGSRDPLPRRFSRRYQSEAMLNPIDHLARSSSPTRVSLELGIPPGSRCHRQRTGRRSAIEVQHRRQRRCLHRQTLHNGTLPPTTGDSCKQPYQIDRRGNSTSPMECSGLPKFKQFTRNVAPTQATFSTDSAIGVAPREKCERQPSAEVRLPVRAAASAQQRCISSSDDSDGLWRGGLRQVSSSPDRPRCYRVRGLEGHSAYCVGGRCVRQRPSTTGGGDRQARLNAPQMPGRSPCRSPRASCDDRDIAAR